MTNEKWCHIWICPMEKYLICVHLLIKLRNFGFESHWNTCFFIKKDLNMSHGKRYDADLNMSHGKMPDFVSLPFFGFTLVIKQRNLNFKSHWNTLILSWATKMMSDLNMSCQCLISFRIRCLCSILVILSWEVGI